MVYGFEEKSNTFKRLADEDNLGQAYLFFGEPQIGKFLFSKHLAYYLEHDEFNILDKPLVDTVIVSPENNSIGLEDLGRLKKFLSQKPFKSSKRLIIIRDAEKLTPHAGSSLLKFVEEASNHTSFIFIATDPQVMLPPLASRLMKVYFPKHSTEEIKNTLIEEFEVPNKKAEKIAKESFGRLGHALDELEDKEKDEDDQGIEEYINDKIKKLYLQDKINNSKSISKLLKREEKINRFNVNPRIQKKAIKHDLKN